MSTHVEWVEAKSAQVTLERTQGDAVRLSLSGDDVVTIEGTLAEVQALVRRMAREVGLVAVTSRAVQLDGLPMVGV